MLPYTESLENCSSFDKHSCLYVCHCRINSWIEKSSMHDCRGGFLIWDKLFELCRCWLYSFKGTFFARKMELKCTDQVLLTNELLISTVLQNEVRVTDPDSRGGSTYHLPVSVYWAFMTQESPNDLPKYWEIWCQRTNFIFVIAVLASEWRENESDSYHELFISPRM